MHLRWLRTVRTISLNDSTVAGLEQLTRGFGKHCPETDYLRENGFFGEFPCVCPEPVLENDHFSITLGERTVFLPDGAHSRACCPSPPAHARA